MNAFAPNPEPELVTCQWWVLCTSDAVTTQWHPSLGQVPICVRCQRRYESL